MSSEATPVPELTFDAAKLFLEVLARENSEWAGLPMPMDGIKLDIDPRYPFAGVFNCALRAREGVFACSNEDVREDEYIRNEWLSVRYGCYIGVLQTGRELKVYYRRKNHAVMELDTLYASRMWDIESELRSMETLRRHLKPHIFEAYFMTGAFIETSKRSGVTYMFRRLRPTIAMKETVPGQGLRILCTLCGHVMGYAMDTWAGALVPTDDIIAALLIMRSDEHLFWRSYNQHPAWAPESGL